MKTFKNITRERVPCWYEFSWREGVGIVFRVHHDIVPEDMFLVPYDAPIVADFIADFGFTCFDGIVGENLGFNRALKFIGRAGEFFEYHVPTPQCRKFSEKPCEHCEGTGKDNFFPGESGDCLCLFCEGAGKGIYYDYEEAYAVSATLTTLLRLLQFPDRETTSTLPQLIVVYTVTMQTAHGSELGGEYGEGLVHYLRRRGPGEIPEMIEAMKAVWKVVDDGLKDYHRHDFQAYVQGEDGWLNTSCPGDRCGLHPDRASVGPRGGYHFGCHNGDNPMQQLTLLAGLAVLHDLARAAAK